MCCSESGIFGSHSIPLLVRNRQNNGIRDTGDQGTPANFRHSFGTQRFSLSSESNFNLPLPSPWLSLVKPLWVALLQPWIIHWGLHTAWVYGAALQETISQMAPVQPKQSVTFNSSCHLIKYMGMLTIKHIFTQTRKAHTTPKCNISSSCIQMWL